MAVRGADAIGRDGLAMLALSGVVALASLGTTLLAALAYVVWIGAATPPAATPASMIIVLGLRLRRDGLPGSRYRRRLDRARLLWRPEDEIVVLGGRTRAGVWSEAEAGARYLEQHGVSGERIRLEDWSRHTLENLREYRSRFGDRPGEPPLLVTSRFHLARSALLARGLRLAHTPCVAEDRASALLRDAAWVVMEAALVHWYVVGRSYARWAGNERMTARIT